MGPQSKLTFLTMLVTLVSHNFILAAPATELSYAPGNQNDVTQSVYQRPEVSNPSGNGSTKPTVNNYKNTHYRGSTKSNNYKPRRPTGRGYKRPSKPYRGSYTRPNVDGFIPPTGDDKVKNMDDYIKKFWEILYPSGKTDPTKTGELAYLRPSSKVSGSESVKPTSSYTGTPTGNSQYGSGNASITTPTKSGELEYLRPSSVASGSGSINPTSSSSGTPSKSTDNGHYSSGNASVSTSTTKSSELEYLRSSSVASGSGSINPAPSSTETLTKPTHTPTGNGEYGSGNASVSASTTKTGELEYLSPSSNVVGSGSIKPTSSSSGTPIKPTGNGSYRSGNASISTTTKTSQLEYLRPSSVASGNGSIKPSSSDTTTPIKPTGNGSYGSGDASISASTTKTGDLEYQRPSFSVANGSGSIKPTTTTSITTPVKPTTTGVAVSPPRVPEIYHRP